MKPRIKWNGINRRWYVVGMPGFEKLYWADLAELINGVMYWQLVEKRREAAAAKVAASIPDALKPARESWLQILRRGIFMLGGF